MSILPGRKSDEEKAVEKQAKKKREMQVAQDSLGFSKGESALTAQRKEEQDNTRNELVVPGKEKQKLKRLLLNKEPKKVDVYLYYCKECQKAYQEKVKKCVNCNSKQFYRSKEGEKIKLVSKGDSKLCNKKGFNKVLWTELEPTISATVSGGYMKNTELQKLNYSSLSTVTMQFSLYPWRYGIDNPTDMQQIGDIIRTPVIAHTSKARGGRALESTEKTLVEKLSRAVTGKNQDEEKPVF